MRGYPGKGLQVVFGGELCGGQAQEAAEGEERGEQVEAENAHGNCQSGIPREQKRKL